MRRFALTCLVIVACCCSCEKRHPKLEVRSQAHFSQDGTNAAYVQECYSDDDELVFVVFNRFKPGSDSHPEALVVTRSRGDEDEILFRKHSGLIDLKASGKVYDFDGVEVIEYEERTDSDRLNSYLESGDAEVSGRRLLEFHHGETVNGNRNGNG